jgi:23S rRNA (uracil1939-C5)-methyltransferase
MAEPVEVEIARLGARGDGVADTPDGPIYVAGTLPGERARVEIEGERGRLVQVVSASAKRAQPVCRHFSRCGGCVAQHMSAGLYHGWKQEIVRAAFAHRGLEPNVGEVFAVPPGSRRRGALAAERVGDDVRLGFHEEGSHALVDIAECPVLDPRIVETLPTLRVVAGEVLGKHTRCGLTVTHAIGGLDVELEGLRRDLSASQRARLGRRAADAGILRLTVSGEIAVQSAIPRLVLGGVEVSLPPGAFLQATAEAETAIGAIIARAVGRAKHVADLFCGVGTFTYGLARQARVLAIDGDAAAIGALKAAAAGAKGLKPVEARVRDLFREPLSRKELEGFDAVMLDPPRAGARAQSEALAKSKVQVIVMVSCNPATLARDCRILVDAGYRLDRVTPVDQFVWSGQVEAVAVLTRVEKGRNRA